MNIRKALLIAFISAVIVLVSAPVAAVAGSSMANDGCDTNPMHPNSPAATCCELGNCFTICCSIPDTPSDKAVVTTLTVPAKNFIISIYKTNESKEITCLFDKPPEQNTYQTLSVHPYGEYHCRNNLDSEASFHI